MIKGEPVFVLLIYDLQAKSPTLFGNCQKCLNKIKTSILRLNKI